MKLLVENGALDETVEPFSSLEAVGRYYPYATLSLRTLRARRRLLPKLIRMIEDRGRVFTEPSSEEHVAQRQIHESEAAREEITARWQWLEQQLLTAISAGAGPSTPSLIGLLVRGRQLFGGTFGTRWAVNQTFGEILASLFSAASKGRFPNEVRSLLTEAAKLFARAIPPDRLTSAELKSRIYNVADFGGTTASLTKEAAWRLVAEDPKLHACLLKKADNGLQPSYQLALLHLSPPEFSEEGREQVRSLLDRDVLKLQVYFRRT